MGGETTDVAESEVDRPAEAAPVEAATEGAPVEAAPASRVGRLPMPVFAGVSAVLLVAAVVFGVLFAQERSDRQRAEHDLRRQAALAEQHAADLAAVQAQRAEIERKLATVEAQLLSPEAKLAISACVKSYAAMEKAIADAERTGSGSSSVQYAVPVGSGPDELCKAAEPHLAKLA